MAVMAIDLLDQGSAGGRAAPLDLAAAELLTSELSKWRDRVQMCVCKATECTPCKGVKSLKNRQQCGIDPIVGIVATFGKN
jgi:hypothetical protein